MGVVSCLGHDPDEFYNNLLEVGSYDREEVLLQYDYNFTILLLEGHSIP
jgi:hypothetical protein